MSFDMTPVDDPAAGDAQPASPILSALVRTIAPPMSRELLYPDCIKASDSEP